MSSPTPCEEEECSKEQVKPKHKKYKGNGKMMTGWTLEELPKILKKICSTYPGINYIEVLPNEIRWNFECRKEDIMPLPREYKLENPSKRKTKKDIVNKLKMS